jgi:hypothetical protein
VKQLVFKEKTLQKVFFKILIYQQFEDAPGAPGLSFKMLVKRHWVLSKSMQQHGNFS